MVVEVEENFLVLDQPFFQPGAIHLIESLNGLNSAYGHSLHLAHTRKYPIDVRVQRSKFVLRRPESAEAPSTVWEEPVRLLTGQGPLPFRGHPRKSRVRTD